MAIAAGNHTIGLDKVEAQLAQIGRHLHQGALENALLAGALPIQNQVKENIYAKLNTTGLAGGMLSSSILVKPADDNTADRVFVKIGTKLEYAAIHEFGGTIVPKKAKFLTIPLTDAARNVDGARSWPGKLKAVINASGQGGVLLDENGTAQFALTKSVTMPARPYMRPAFDEKKGEAVQDFVDALNAIIRQAVAHAG